jgi:putative nucleotidyltransferase with HDIG domain
MKSRAEFPFLGSAREIFGAIGTALNIRSIFGETHTRFQIALQKLMAAIETYRRENPGSSFMTFLLDGEEVQFNMIPLVGLASAGERMLRLFLDTQMGGFQIGVEIDADGLKQLLVALKERLRCPGGPIPPGKSKADGFRLIGPEEARDLRRGGEEGPPAAGGVDEGLRIPEFMVPEDSCRSFIESCRAILANKEGGLPIEPHLLEQVSDSLVTTINAKRGFQALLPARSYFDDFNFHHSVNVCFLATTMASRILNDPEKLRAISKAALLHDIGKGRVPAEIIHKPGKLTQAESEVIKCHPIYGAEILLGVEGIDPLCVSVAFGHHIRQGPGSYPSTRRPYPCDPVTQLIAVADIYEALVSARPYKKGLSPQAAFKILFSMPGLQNRLPLLRLLFDCLGPFPLGSIVELDTGERGMVVEHDASRPYAPKVRVFTDSERRPLGESHLLDLSASRVPEKRQIRRAVVPQGPESNPLTDDIKEESGEILGEAIRDECVLMDREG